MILGSSRAKRERGDKPLLIYEHLMVVIVKQGRQIRETGARDGVNGEISTCAPPRPPAPSLGSRRWQLYGESDKSRDPSWGGRSPRDDEGADDGEYI